VSLAAEELDHLYDADASPETQRTAFTCGSVPVAVYGLGKMGLPLAVVYAGVTGNVIGADIDPDVVVSINTGNCPVENEPGLADAVPAAVDAGALRATPEPAVAADNARVHVVIVPTLIDGDDQPDLAPVRAVTKAIGDNLQAGDTVVVESTVPPGTCRDVIEPTLAAHSGLDPDAFGLAFCPERTASGRALKDIRSAYPKVVGGRDAESTRVAELVYGEITTNDVLPVADATTAECVKVFEGVYRDVNIALANELARFGEELGVDIREAIAVANTQPFCDIHDPGPGVGGHCIPYYPYFLINGCATPAPLLAQARAVNDGMAAHTVERLARAFDRRGKRLDGSHVLLLGVTYRPGVDETRASPAIGIAEQLRERDVTVSAVDPVCSDMSGLAATPTRIDRMGSLDLDAAVLVTPQDAFGTVDWDQWTDLVVLDTRGALDDAGPHDVVTLGNGSAM
jgi:UDP-N-acetyl-D-mannosaminuronic acid dehydrogenase